MFTFPFSRMEPSYVVKMKFLILQMAVRSKLIRYFAHVNNFNYLSHLCDAAYLFFICPFRLIIVCNFDLKDYTSSSALPSRIKRVFYMSSEGSNLLHEVGTT